MRPDKPDRPTPAVSDQPDSAYVGIANAMKGIFVIFDASRNIHYMNPTGRRMLGFPADEDIFGARLDNLKLADASASFEDLLASLASSGGNWQGTVVLTHRDGYRVQASATVVSLRPVSNGPALFAFMRAEDTHDTNKLAHGDLFKKALDCSKTPIIIIDSRQEGHPIIYANPAFEAVTGSSPDESVGQNVTVILESKQNQPELVKIRDTFSHQCDGHAVISTRVKDGRLVWNEIALSPIQDDRGHVTHYIGILNDITERKEAEERLLYLATHDELCGIPNRALLIDKVGQAMAQSAAAGTQCAVLYFGIDRLKVINESLGYAVGDAILKETADRLSASLRAGDTLARIGSDEFAMLLKGVQDTPSISQSVAHFKACLAVPFPMAPAPQSVTASLGIAVYPSDGDDPELLVQNAAISMHQAKLEGRNNCRFFAQNMNEAASRHRLLEHDLRLAFERQELCLYYQPQLELASGRITGVESLLRWQHPQLGWISPAEFIPAAEESGLIIALGEWVLREACRQAVAWHQRGHPSITVAVNLSAHQFRQPDLVGAIKTILSETGLDPRYLELELTESSLMSNPDDVSRALFKLRELGLQVSVDDFGTGYSSLSYLRRFPVTKVKIDRSFITNVTTQPEDAAVTRAVISMGHGLKLRVIAEGVETDMQKTFLLRHGCDGIQGYLISPPVPPETCTEILKKFADPGNSNMSSPEQQPALLLVDDEPSLLRALWRTLRLDGYRVLMANSAREGLDILAREEVGVIISDQRMPEMTGVEFLRRVKELYPRTIRIVLSGYTELDSVTSAINEGAIYKFLTKPWEDEQLRENVNEAFRRFKMEQENQRLTDELRLANDALSRINRSLEQQVAEKVQEIAHNIGMLQVSQEILESLPIGIVGIDEHGMIAFSNRQADSLFQGGLLGDTADGRFPPSILPLVQNTPESGGALVDAGKVRLENEHEYQVFMHTMGESSRSKGTIVMFLPVSGSEG